MLATRFRISLGRGVAKGLHERDRLPPTIVPLVDEGRHSIESLHLARRVGDDLGEFIREKWAEVGGFGKRDKTRAEVNSLGCGEAPSGRRICS